METMTEPAPMTALDLPEPPTPIVLILAGRTFRRPPMTSLIQDAYVMQRMRSVDMEGTMRVSGSSPVATGLDVVMAMFESGMIYEVLAGALVEDGMKWTRSGADANAAFFAELTDQADKDQIWQHAAAISKDFLEGAAQWLRAFPKSSAAQSGNGAAPALHSNLSGEIPSTITANGMASSASSPITTQTNTSASRPGRSRKRC